MQAIVVGSGTYRGDTDVFSDMALIAKIHSPQIGLVPFGDRFNMSGRTAALRNAAEGGGEGRKI